MGRELLGEFLGEQARGAGLENLLQETVGDAFEHEIADDEARHDLDARRIEVDVLLDRPIEQLAVQKDQRDVAGLVGTPTASLRPAAGCTNVRGDAQPLTLLPCSVRSSRISGL